MNCSVDCCKLHVWSEPRDRAEVGDTYTLCAELFIRATPFSVDLPSRFGDKCWERKPVVVLVLLEVCEGDH